MATCSRKEAYYFQILPMYLARAMIRRSPINLIISETAYS